MGIHQLDLLDLDLTGRPKPSLKEPAPHHRRVRRHVRHPQGDQSTWLEGPRRHECHRAGWMANANFLVPCATNPIITTPAYGHDIPASQNLQKPKPETRVNVLSRQFHIKGAARIGRHLSSIPSTDHP